MFRQHKTLKTFVSVIVILQFGFLMPLSPVLAADLQRKDLKAEVVVDRQINYTSLMRDIKDLSDGNVASRQQVLSDFFNFIDQEKDHLDSLPVGFYKKGAYINRLSGQLKGIDDVEQSSTKRILEKIKDFFGFGVEELSFDKKSEQNQKEFKMPDNPAEFGFNRDTPKFEKISNITVPANQKINKSIKAFITIQEAKAASVLPVLEDLKGDEHEIIINSTIRDLASDLNNNPVEIFNFIRENIDYEAYYGSKKGNLGCLEEKICNDVDTASLTVSLMRAAGIPAHYKKSLIVVSIKELQDLLGIEKTVEGRRTAYGILAWNKVPVFSITNNPTLGENLDGGDFTNETNFALEWVFPEIYYDYDERGGNIDNQDDLGAASTIGELHNLLQDKYKKQWLPLDVIFKNYNYTQKQIVADSANFDTESFWYGYLQYQGDLSPLKKYAQDLLNATGKDINNQTYQSTNSSVTKNYEILPPTLPYVLGEGVDGDGGEILPETWSALPDARKIQVKIQLKKADTKAVVLEHTFFGSEINNKEINLFYEGATQSDQQIIDSYGGIHATPAELVDIKAHFLGDNARYDGTEVFGIGDSMILRFEYYVKGVLEHDDEKFSTAGNQEGIFVVLSQVQEDPYLDTNSKILLRGNVGLAREYLRQVQESGGLFEKSLDYNYNVNFSRAVVTQNRILNTVNGAPTTFDFKGLTIDAGTYINDWSNRGNYKTHRKDFRLLFGLESSFYEGQIFDNVAGLEGISTVTGLQYAYAHPADYTVHTIKSVNESVIDSLALSDNTKANMHADVQKGNTIVTPNKFVTAGNWNGIFYVSLDPVWTGTYAIGEQAQSNGGWTTVYFNSEEVGVFKNEGNEDNFIFYDGSANTLDKRCRIAKETFLDIMNNSGWQEEFGLPCMKEDITFGSNDFVHKFILTLNAAKFYRANKYEFWKSENDILLKMKFKLTNWSIVSGQLHPYWGTYTYSVGSSEWKNPDDIKKLAVYNPEDNSVSVIQGEMAQKYISSDKVVNQFIPQLVGFPTADMDDAVESFVETNGKYQNFTNGQMYKRESLWPFGWGDEITIVYGKIGEFYNADENMKDGQRGSGGVLGFPMKDPELSNNSTLQKFEEANIVYNQNNGYTSISNQSEESRRYQNKEFAIKITKKIADGIISDVEAFAKIADQLAGRIGISTDDFVKDMTQLFVGSDKIGNVSYFLSSGVNFVGKVFGITSGEREFQVSGFSDTGFAFKYNDSHYCINSGGISNQLYHSMAGFSVGYFIGPIAVDVVNIIHEGYTPSALGKNGSSMEDIRLTQKMGVLGYNLKNNIISKNVVGTWIRENIKNEMESPPTNRILLAQRCVIQKKFRLYEENIIGDILNKWQYNSGMATKVCKDITYYYQDYSYFDTQKPARAVINGDNVYLVGGNILKKYDAQGGICGVFGLPTGEFDINTKTQNFEHGIIYL